MSAIKAKAESCCTATKQCLGMKAAMQGAGEREIGFHYALMIDMKKGETYGRLAYRFPKKVNGVAVILVNVCPWCGQSVKP